MFEQFSSQDLRDTQRLLTSLFNEVNAQESMLSGGTKLSIGGAAIQGLRETKVAFGNPKNNLIKLTSRLFENIGVELTEIWKQQMRDQFDFYYLSLSVSLQTTYGVQFKQVECKLDFGLKGSGEVIVQTIFPTSAWQEVLSWGGEVNLALNGNLDWGAELNSPVTSTIVNLPAHVRANIANKGNLKAFIAVPSYTFKLGRAKIIATGAGNSECFWRIEHPDLRETQSVQFSVVFKVPKGTPSIELTGLVAAEPSINWLVDNLRNVFEYLSEQLQALLRRDDAVRSGIERLPIGDYEQWTLPLLKPIELT